MSARKKINSLIMMVCLAPLTSDAAISSLTADNLARQLGWVASTDNNCGGYYLEPPLVYPISVAKDSSIEITSNQTLFTQHGTSMLEGKVTVTRYGQQLTANKAYLYRNPDTGKLSSMEVIGNVHLREPNTLIVGRMGRYNFETKTKSLSDIFYRTALNGREVIGPNVSDQEMQSERKITNLTAWGSANEFSQTEPKIYELYNGSFSTCPPINPAWRVKASHIVLNKNTGRGYAVNARVLVKNIPVLYTPYISFPIDRRRKSGFLWPTLGANNKWGPYFLAPYYWNMAPNYDMTITPGYLSKRGLQLSDKFRYLTRHSDGYVTLTVLPGDTLFSEFQTATKENPFYSQSTSPVTQAELNRLLNSSTVRRSLVWRNESRYNEHWSSDVDYNYAGDDYYLRDFGNNLNEITANQLLQEADLNYKGLNWNFTGRLQTYQTMHPIDEPAVVNQYRWFPQLILNGDYPDQALGLEYFVNNELTHFDIRNTPGAVANLPIGNRINIQPGISLPLTWSSFYVNPRIQVALTGYQLYQTADTETPTSIHRSIPIFDIASGAALDKDITLFSYAFQQTLEPQIYYTYIPLHRQSDIPVLDTTVNNLTYDQLFNYNRFSGIDRIGDANQVGIGVTSRLIDQDSGIEKARLGVGEIVYFANRIVTLCTTSGCSDNPDNHSNYQRLSPLSGLFNYNVTSTFGINANALWNPTSKQLANSTINLHYQPDTERSISLGYSYVFQGDIFSGAEINSAANNLKLTDLSVVWPILTDVTAVGRWSHDWNTNHFQNIIYGLQYDTCCWAMRVAGGRAFTNLSPINNTPMYNNEFYIQFALKGLGNVGNSNPSKLLSSISGYNPQFGQEI